jgi:A/G-specific adenine glycosylase
MVKPKASSRRKTAGEGTALAGPLLEWYARKRRDLPWRENPTPYRVWISEVMLQQTRVEVVIPRYQRFLRRFPSLESLAAASEAEVLSEWSGLGYYRRARALHSAARVVMSDHGGRFPRELAAARSLPGVGPYTAGAVLSIAYNLPVPILDGNVERVLARVFRIGGDPGRGAAKRRLWELAAEAVSAAEPSRLNQALMELGALVCLPARPRCEECPLGSLCGSGSRGDAGRFPGRAPGRAREELTLLAAVIAKGGRYLFEERGRSGAAYLRGLWGFPLAESPAGGDGALRERLERDWGLETGPGVFLGEFRHSITFRRIRVRAFRLALRSLPAEALEPRSGGGRLAWAPLGDLGVALPASSLALKVKREVLEPEAQSVLDIRGPGGQTQARGKPRTG